MDKGEELLTLARKAKADGWMFRRITPGRSDHKYGCVMGAALFAKGLRGDFNLLAADDFTEYLGVSAAYADGVMDAFDGNWAMTGKTGSRYDEYMAGYGVGTRGRAEFLDSLKEEKNA